MPPTILYFDHLISLMRRPNGADIHELMRVAELYYGRTIARSTMDRHIEHLRYKMGLPIAVRHYRYFLEADENLNRFLTASVNSQFAQVVQTHPEEEVIFDMGYFALGANAYCMQEVIKALKARRQIIMEYRSFVDWVVKRKTVEPMFIRWWSSQWYLFARDILYDDTANPRAYRLDCILSAKLGEPFVLRPQDARGSFGRNFIGVSGHDTDAVPIEIHADEHATRWIIHTIDHPTIKIEILPDKWAKISWMLDPNEEFLELLMRIHADFKIIGPQLLIDRYRSRLERLSMAIEAS